MWQTLPSLRWERVLSREHGYTTRWIRVILVLVLLLLLLVQVLLVLVLLKLILVVLGIMNQMLRDANAIGGDPVRLRNRVVHDLVHAKQGVRVPRAMFKGGTEREREKGVDEE